MDERQAVHAWIAARRERFQAELFEFLRIPSISTHADGGPEMRRAAEWLRAHMVEAGLKATLHETPGHPIVVGEWRGAGESAPTVLIYGHYDVQPPEPLAAWTSPPFEPALRDGRIYARGSVDDKGQLHLHVKAIEAHLAVNGTLPVNVILLAEGEEEVGSVNLIPFVRTHREHLACDAIVISDTPMVAAGVPTIGASLRGLAYLEIHVEGPAQDLHSGTYGGAVLNPATALARIIASLHDAEERVAIDGFYDDVDAAETLREHIRRLPLDDAKILALTGSPMVWGERGFSTAERTRIRPTCEVNGLLSGYTAEGAKTVLPAKAMAKVSCRLVPDQDPGRIAELFRQHVARAAPAGVKVTVTELHGGRPWRARLEGRLVDAAVRALRAAWQREVVFAGSGGSIPVVPEFEEVLGAPALLLGFGLPGQNAHAPDEWLSVENYEKGTDAAAGLLFELAS